MMEQPISQTQVQSKATNTVYMREYQRKNRIKNKKCKKCGEQACVKTLLEQEYLCDVCDIKRIKEKYPKKESSTSDKTQA